MFKKAGREFCLSTGLHGYQFIVKPRTAFTERVIWTVLVFSSLITTTAIALIAWRETTQKLIQTVTDSTHHSIWNYNFPAVTICGFNQISKTSAHAEARRMIKPPNITSEDMSLKLRLLISLYTYSAFNVTHQDIDDLQEILDYNQVSANQLLSVIAPDCKKLVDRCKWKGEEKRCEILFEQIRTPVGYCCSFNYYALRNHRFGGALPEKTPLEPRRVSGCGYKTGLEVVLHNAPQDYYATNVASYGYRVLIHHPFDYPSWGIYNMWLNTKLTMFLSVYPTLTKTNEKVAELPIDKRNCLFNTELKLNNFQYYTHHNCLMECRIKLILKMCNCIPFYLYNENGNWKNVSVCDLKSIPCIQKYEGITVSSTPGKNASYDIQKEVRDMEPCTCLPNCEYTYYKIECSTGEFSRQYAINGLSLYKGITVRNQSVLRVFFSDLVGTKNTTFLTYYWHTLLALFGGLFSLFTGFNFGCVVEVLYFFLIRVLIDSEKKRIPHDKKGTRSEALNHSILHGEKTFKKPRKNNAISVNKFNGGKPTFLPYLD